MLNILFFVFGRGGNYSVEDYVDEDNVYLLKYGVIAAFLFLGYLVYKVVLPYELKRRKRKDNN